jgi:hypothetical protein
VVGVTIDPAGVEGEDDRWPGLAQHCHQRPADCVVADVAQLAVAILEDVERGGN